MRQEIRNMFLKSLISKLISLLVAVTFLFLLFSSAFAWEKSWSGDSVIDYKDEYGSLKKTLNGMVLSANSRLFIKYFDLPSEAQYGNNYVLDMSFIRSEKASAGLIFKGENSGFELSISSKGYYQLLYFEIFPKSTEIVITKGDFRITKSKTIARLEYEPLSSNLKAYINDRNVFDEKLNSLKKGVKPPMRIIKIGLSAINDKRGDIGEVLIENLSVIAN